MTVRSGAAGKESAVLNSNICSSSTMKMKIWCCEYRSSIEMDTVCNCNFVDAISSPMEESGNALLHKVQLRKVPSMTSAKFLRYLTSSPSLN